MVAKIPFLVACPCCSIQCCSLPPLCSRYSGRRSQTPRSLGAKRPFATAWHDDGFPKDAHDGKAEDREPSGWPGRQKQHSGPSSTGHYDHSRVSRHGHILPWPASKNPTPYEIFSQARGAPYQKARYYELVKQYHPDRRQHVPGHLRQLSAATMTERYRLVVVANGILSNPTKRRAYDLYGVGWVSQGADMHEALRTAHRAWREQRGTAAHNATWEDWERWRSERDGVKKQEPQFMSNGGFAVVVVFFVLLAGWGQATRAGSSSMTMLEARARQQQAISTTMYQQQMRTARQNREERVGSFLERREGWGYALSPSPRADAHMQRRRAVQARERGRPKEEVEDGRPTD